MEKKENDGLSYFTKLGGVINARISNGEVWLSRKQMSKLYQVSQQAIGQRLSILVRAGGVKGRVFRTKTTGGQFYDVSNYPISVVYLMASKIKKREAIDFFIWAHSKGLNAGDTLESIQKKTKKIKYPERIKKKSK